MLRSEVAMHKPCPFCAKGIETSLVRHIKTVHGEETLRRAILIDKRDGIPDAQIGDKYGVSFSYLERVITQEYGANLSTVSRKGSRGVTQWGPKQFQLEKTTVWSFKNRGNWATHDGRYRGNWSPYIPRNIILRYSKPDEVVLDYFVGSGTTAVEAKLLGRSCIARDINPEALALTKENLDFQIPGHDFSLNTSPTMQVEIGDARDLSSIKEESIDLICAHPPYAGIIRYSANSIEGDLSTLSVPQFLDEMRKVARESYRVLKPGRQCAILIGDSRKSKHVVPIGFWTIRTFLDTGFILRELIIKRQHNCKTTGFWYSNSIRYNFLLLAHEFLPVFEKPAKRKAVAEATQLSWLPTFDGIAMPEQSIERVQRERLETTTVWIFPARTMQADIRRNLLGRFAKGGHSMLEIELDENEPWCDARNRYTLAYIHGSETVFGHLQLLDNAVAQATKHLARDGLCVIETRDFRRDGVLIPMGLIVFERLAKSGLELREIVIVTSEENRPFEPPPEGCLGIAHKYLLIYRKT